MGAMTHEEAQRLLSDVKPEHFFYLSDSSCIHNIEELAERVGSISDEEFVHHVNENGNNFRNWIEDCIKDKVLSASLNGMISRGNVENLINKRIDELRKVLAGDNNAESGSMQKYSSPRSIVKEFREKFVRKNTEEVKTKKEDKPTSKITHGKLRRKINDKIKNINFRMLNQQKEIRKDIKEEMFGIHNEIKDIHGEINKEIKLHHPPKHNKRVHKYDHKEYMHWGATEFIQGLIMGIIAGLIIARMIL